MLTVPLPFPPGTPTAVCSDVYFQCVPHPMLYRLMPIRCVRSDVLFTLSGTYRLMTTCATNAPTFNPTLPPTRPPTRPPTLPPTEPQALPVSLFECTPCIAGSCDESMAVGGVCPDGCPATPAQGDASSGGEDNASASSDTIIIAAIAAVVAICCIAAALAMFFCQGANGDKGAGRQAFDNPLCTDLAPHTTRTCNGLIRAGRHCRFDPKPAMSLPPSVCPSLLLSPPSSTLVR